MVFWATIWRAWHATSGVADQVNRVAPYLGHFARWVETLKRSKRILVVNVPIHRASGLNVSDLLEHGVQDKKVKMRGLYPQMLR